MAKGQKNSREEEVPWVRIGRCENERNVSTEWREAKVRFMKPWEQQFQLLSLQRLTGQATSGDHKPKSVLNGRRWQE